MQTPSKSNVEFIPEFKNAYFHPRYWGVWLGVGLLAASSFVPRKWRDPLLGKLGQFIGRYAKSARRRARINLLYCFPQMRDVERDLLIDNMFASAAQSMVLIAEIALRNPQNMARRTVWVGEEHLTALRQAGRNIILMVPHGWCVDIPAMLLAQRGIKMAAMIHNQRNPLADWLWNTARRRFGGRLHTRLDGIKPFIASVRQGYIGYYLPDEDHGTEQSEFVDFFGTYKSTLPAIGRLMKVCRADIVPLFPVYNAQSGLLEVHIRPAMQGLAEADMNHIARQMNQEVEALVSPNPEQYTWILKLLNTRKEGETEPYVRNDL